MPALKGQNQLLDAYVVKPRKLHNKNADDGVIGFHVWRGLLLLYLAFLGFPRAFNRRYMAYSATLPRSINS